ncbi:MAG TPA: putative DNA-binding domain-containing protein [Verrucomicrobiae bacterium]|nr:putative DNA-binding domain-containing protein [Verrucomicrobiae bacterium]
MKRSRPTNLSSVRKPPPRKRQTAAELRALQRLMARAVMRPLTPELRMRAKWSDGRATEKVAAKFMKPNDRLTSFERLEIYNRQYWLRVLECFYDDFPGVRAVLGENGFRDFAVAYLANHPSTRFTLRDLGSHVVEFIDAEPRWAGAHRELARDIARLEWAHIEAFDGEAKTPLTLEDLQGRDAAKLRLHLQPHLTLLELGYPLDEFLIALRENTRLRGEASNAVEDMPGRERVKRLRLPKKKIVWLAVHRHQNMVYYKRLEQAQYDLLLAIRGGATLERALQIFSNERALPPIEKWFRQWASLGWFWLK